MRSTAVLALFSLAVTSAASPAEGNQGAAAVVGRQASGCYPHQNPRCCVDTVCQCADGTFYEFNRDNANAGGNGCDPPWAFIGDNPPGYCC